MAKLHIEGKNESYNIEDKPIIVGRSSKCDITINDNNFSRHHFEISKNPDGYYIKDLNSFNGTFLNDKKIVQIKLRNNDKIVVGKVNFFFTDDNEVKSDQASAYILLGKPNKWNKKIFIQAGKNTIGRKKSNDICISDDQVSSCHSEIFSDEFGYKIKDLQSRNGTFLNDKRMESHRNYKINNGDMLQFGSLYCLFKDPNVVLSKKKKNTLLNIILPIIIIVLFLSVFVVGYIFQNNLQEASYILENVTNNYSFEDNVVGWQFGGVVTRIHDAQNAKSGEYFLKLQGNGEINHREPISIEHGKVYNFSCWVRHENLQKATIKISWQCDNSYYIERFTPFINGTSSKWYKVSQTMTPPLYARNFNVSFVVSGKSNYIDIDDFIVVPIDEVMDENSDITRLEQKNIRVDMDHRGHVDVYRGKEFLVGGAHCQILHDDNIIDQTFLDGKTTRQQNSLNWTDTSLTTENIRVHCKIVDDGVIITYLLSPALINKKITCSFQISTNYASQIKIITEKEAILASIDNFASRKNIKQIVWQQQVLGLLYEQAVDCSVDIGKSFILKQTFSNSSNKISIKIKTNFDKDRNELKKLERLASKQEKEKLLGQAYLSYQKILGNFFLYEAKIAPQVKMKKLQRNFSEDVKEAKKILNVALFFGQIYQYNTCILYCENAKKRWNGLNKMITFDSIIKKARNAKRKIEIAKISFKVTNLLDRAKDFEKRKQNTLALFCYEELLYYEQNEEKKSKINAKINILKEQK